MKRTKKNTPVFSEKIKEKLKKAGSKKSTKRPVGIAKSTASIPTPEKETSVENKPLDGSLKIDHLPFDSQANLIFNPLMGFDQRLVAGTPQSGKDPFAPSGFIVGKKK